MYKPFVKNYLLITSFTTFVIGVLLLFWPERILQWFIPGASGDFFVRFIGSALIGYAALNFMTAQSKNAEAQRLALWSNLITLSIATILSIYGVISGQIQAMQALLIIEHVIFTAGFAACLYFEYNV